MRKHYFGAVADWELEFRGCVRARIEELELSVAEASRRCRLDQRHLWAIMSGRAPLNWKRIPDICSALGLYVEIFPDQLIVRKLEDNNRVRPRKTKHIFVRRVQKRKILAIEASENLSLPRGLT